MASAKSLGAISVLATKQWKALSAEEREKYEIRGKSGEQPLHTEVKAREPQVREPKKATETAAPTAIAAKEKAPVKEDYQKKGCLAVSAPPSKEKACVKEDPRKRSCPVASTPPSKRARAEGSQTPSTPTSSKPKAKSAGATSPNGEKSAPASAKTPPNVESTNIAAKAPPKVDCPNVAAKASPKVDSTKPSKDQIKSAVKVYIEARPTSWTSMIMTEDLALAKGWAKAPSLLKQVRGALKSLGIIGTCAMNAILPLSPASDASAAATIVEPAAPTEAAPVEAAPTEAGPVEAAPPEAAPAPSAAREAGVAACMLATTGAAAQKKKKRTQKPKRTGTSTEEDIATQEAVKQYIDEHPTSWTVRIMHEELSAAKGWDKKDKNVFRRVHSALRRLGFTGNCALVPHLDRSMCGSP